MGCLISNFLFLTPLESHRKTSTKIILHVALGQLEWKPATAPELVFGKKFIVMIISFHISVEDRQGLCLAFFFTPDSWSTNLGVLNNHVYRIRKYHPSAVPLLLSQFNTPLPVLLHRGIEQVFGNVCSILVMIDQ